MPKPAGALPAKLEDYYRDPPYERRLVVFYDILGWRTKIKQAGRDPKELGELRRVILHHARILKFSTQWNVRVTTFSDNIVLSRAPDESSELFIQQLGPLLLGAALSGFLLRGGVAVGDLIHDDEVVFGPALNRAYELESKLADVPRVLIDNNVIDELNLKTGVIVREGGRYFLDPFTIRFVKYISKIQKGGNRPQLSEAGIPTGGRLIREVGSDRILNEIRKVLKEQITSALEDKEWRKVAWLYDRIAGQLGMPPASRYQRVRPETAAT